MNATSKKRGRPAKRPETLERRRIDAILRTARETLGVETLDPNSSALMDVLAGVGDNTRERIIREWTKSDPTLPHALIWQLESIDDEGATADDIQAVHELYARHKNSRATARAEGQQTNAEKAEARAAPVLSHPTVHQLIERIKTGSRYTVNAAATRIHRDWDDMFPGIPQLPITTLRRILSSVVAPK